MNVVGQSVIAALIGDLSPRTVVVIVAAAAVGALAWYGRRAASRREREWIRRFDAGRCLHCGYDKCADPRGRCPECGRF